MNFIKIEIKMIKNTLILCQVKALGQILFPIWNEIGLSTWWMKIENITNQLLKTYQGNPNKD